ncbi:MAG: hypothetical protein ACRCY7_04445 [Cetobacterium sp.]|uniref:hypothetical protein n=1 Tax=Cetobacterium sp. TaxID=2071632 RepID=UPI003F3F3D11
MEDKDIERYRESSLLELFLELKKNTKDEKLLNYVKGQINSNSGNPGEIENILNLMEKAEFYIGFKRETIWGYLGSLGLLNFPTDTIEVKSYVESLKQNQKIKYIKSFLYYELNDLIVVRAEKNEKLREKMLKMPEYKVLDAILEHENTIDISFKIPSRKKY